MRGTIRNRLAVDRRVDNVRVMSPPHSSANPALQRSGTPRRHLHSRRFRGKSNPQGR